MKRARVQGISNASSNDLRDDTEGETLACAEGQDVWVQFHVGIEGEEGEELHGLHVTPDPGRAHAPQSVTDDAVLYVSMAAFDADTVERAIRERVEACEGETAAEGWEQVQRFAHWVDNDEWLKRPPSPFAWVRRFLGLAT